MSAREEAVPRLLEAKGSLSLGVLLLSLGIRGEFEDALLRLGLGMQSSS